MSNNPTPDVPDIAALRAANTQYGLDVLRKFIELSTELATLLVEDARQTTASDAPPSRKANHAADFEQLFRGVRRAVLLTQKLLAEPEPPRAPPAPKPNAPQRPLMPLGARGWQPPQAERDGLDRLDDDPPLPSEPSDQEKILTICRELNIKAIHGNTPLIDRPLKEVKQLTYKVTPAIAGALMPFGLQSAWGRHPKLPDTS